MSVVYITGASAGLGRAIARVFASNGDVVGIIARDETALEETAGEIGGKSAWAAADVAVYTQLERAVHKLNLDIGPPDIWINSAMATIFSRFEDISPEEFAQSIHITLLGSVYGLRVALQSMKGRSAGHIIQIGSALAYRAIPLQAPYCAAKSGIRSVVDSLRCELIHDNSPIKITMVQMPAMNTPQFDWARRHIAEQPQPVPPIFSPMACAQAVLWAANHPGRREVWVGMPTFAAIIGNNWFPALMDHYLAKRAFEGQFEKLAPKRDTEGNLFAPFPADRHRTEGHFSDRQSNNVYWLGTSLTQEVAVIAAIVFAIVLLIVKLLL